MIIRDEYLVRGGPTMGRTGDLPRAVRQMTVGPRPPVAGPPIRFWNVAAVGEDDAEITLYGEICAQQPVDWWTGDPLPGNYITPEGFMEDLETIRNRSRITIRLNSVGGDLYTSIAIHNALRDLAGHKTVIIEGIAASGGSVIACSGDSTEAYAGSMVMIHGVSGLLYDYYGIPELRQVIRGFDAGERAIAEIYNAKTGIDVETLRSMMTRETWMTGKEALDRGFVNVLREGPSPQMSISADRSVLMVNGVRHSLKGFRSIPGTIPVGEGITAGSTYRPKIKTNTSEGGRISMTLEELKEQFPELYSQAVQEGRASVAPPDVETLRAQLQQQERQRMQEIDAIAPAIGDPALINQAKYGDTPMTAEELALKALQHQAALGDQFMKNREAECGSAGAGRLGAVPNSGQEEDAPDTRAGIMETVNLLNSMKSGGAR